MSILFFPSILSAPPHQIYLKAGLLRSNPFESSSHEIIFASLPPCRYLERYAPIHKCSMRSNWRYYRSEFLYFLHLTDHLSPANCAQTSQCCRGYCIPDTITPSSLGDQTFRNAATCGTENGDLCRLPGGEFIALFFVVFILFEKESRRGGKEY